MKTKKNEAKLALSKKTIANLNNAEMLVYGGTGSLTGSDLCTFTCTEQPKPACMSTTC